ncbi:MAG TPA: class I SAM-dependent methyltransferase [Acidimicrobiales bacterium]|nr:class I SAM-dependent methyltransferase [Acidimicrobiales bacterium]
MARTDYSGRMAGAYDRGRALEAAAVEAWAAAVGPFLPRHPAGPVLDLGSGTGRFSGHLVAWAGAPVVAVEPAAAMAEQARDKGATGVHVAVGAAEAIPLRDGSVAAAWLSQVIHHVPDLARAAGELARVMRPGASVMLRGATGRDGDGNAPSRDFAIYRYFPAAGAVADGFPSRRTIVDAFRGAGFVEIAATKVAQVTATSLRSLYERTCQRADSTLAAIDDDFAAGLDALRRDAEAETRPTPVVDRVDLIVLRLGGA